ncbi:MAG: hypothetical protein CMJ87_06020 [Planctomycetes bacterium]|jgi:imidazolonepropionase-like amidohydrolase|nr:hypothetical protein [Planctomycetota bacterium]MDP6518921.1 amidohydrolase family protein [Planctomycetota bacterium]
MIPTLLLTLATAANLAPVTGTQDDERTRWSIHAEKIYAAPGELIENGSVRVDAGKITRLGSGGGGDISVYAITAGLVDASVRIHEDRLSVEESSEIQPALRVADTLDPFSHLWQRQLRSGVTTVMVSPLDRNVVGGLSVVLKTGGPENIAARTVAVDAALCGAIGSSPSRGNHAVYGLPTDFFSRRPTTRMGVEWEWRRAFYDAALAQRHGAELDEDARGLLQVLAGVRPLFIQAWATQDIRTAAFFVEEMAREDFGQIRLIVDAAAEAWKEPAFLVRTGAGVVLPPFPHNGRSGPDRAFTAWSSAAQLHAAGIPLALSSHGAQSPADRLDRQAGYAMRGGLPFDAALAAVTLTPARMLGVDESVGSIAVGKDADLVLWNGEPFAATSRAVGVLLEGRLIVDPREEN